MSHEPKYGEILQELGFGPFWINCAPRKVKNNVGTRRVGEDESRRKAAEAGPEADQRGEARAFKMELIQATESPFEGAQARHQGHGRNALAAALLDEAVNVRLTEFCIKPLSLKNYTIKYIYRGKSVCAEDRI